MNANAAVYYSVLACLKHQLYSHICQTHSGLQYGDLFIVKKQKKKENSSEVFIVVLLIVLLSRVCLFIFSMQWMPFKICIWEFFFVCFFVFDRNTNHSISFPPTNHKSYFFYFFLFSLNREITACHSHIAQMCNLAPCRGTSLLHMKQALLPFFVGPHYLGIRAWFGLVNRQWCSLAPFFFSLPSSSSLPLMPEEGV